MANVLHNALVEAFHRDTWVVATRSEIEGQWVGFCPEFDVVSQGNNLLHAIQMTMEAVTFVLTDDLARGANPDDRRAPDEEWAELREILAHGEFRPEPPDDGDARAVAAQVSFHVWQIANAPGLVRVVPAAPALAPARWTQAEASVA